MMRHLVQLGFVAGLLCGCADEDDLSDPLVFERPETALGYEAVLTGMPDDETQALAESALAVFRQQDDGANSLAFLRRRAESDIPLIQKILRAEGFYQGTVALTVEETQAATEDNDAEALVTLMVDPGAQLALSRHDLGLTREDARAPDLDAASFGSPVGGAARAGPILDAEKTAEAVLRREGFPYAERGRRRAVADFETGTLEIDTPLSPGPFATYGPVQIDGLEDVCARYLMTYQPWQDGEVFNRDRLRAFQQALLGTDLFDTVLVQPPEVPPEATLALPVEVTVTERPFRTVSAGARFNTDDGPSVTGSFQHRNLFCENETLTLTAEIGLPLQELTISYREPQYARPGQDLLAGLVLRREEDDAYDALTAIATLGIERRLSPRWTVGIGGLGEVSQITDEGVESTAFLAGVPMFAAYDDTDDVLDPTEGARLRVELTPFAGLFDDDFASFLVADAKASTYYDITGERKYILAGRARLGSILADDIGTVPQTRRLYSGGGGSVRGYAQRFVGPLDGNNDPIGGLSVIEVGSELRARLYGDLGGVLFIEAGAVGNDAVPTFDEDLQASAGLGLRYYSPAGPIRIDVALPINPRDADDAFQVYFSIGQAF